MAHNRLIGDLRRKADRLRILQQATDGGASDEVPATPHFGAEMQDDLRRVVLPRPPERLGQFMARIFRQQVEEEQKMLMDSDSMRLAGVPKRTPSKPHAAQTPSKATPAHAEQAGGTMPMVPPVRKPLQPARLFARCSLRRPAAAASCRTGSGG